MDRTGDLARGSRRLQGNRHLRFRDGRDRGRAPTIVTIGCVIHRYKVTSGSAPFADSSPTSVAAKVMMGKRPKRPKDHILTDGLWRLTQRCLEENPRRRPGITEVVFYLRRTLAGLQEPIVSSGTCCSIPGYQRWRRYKSGMSIRENGPTSDSTCSAKSGEPDVCEGVQFARLRRLLPTTFHLIMINRHRNSEYRHREMSKGVN